MCIFALSNNKNCIDMKNILLILCSVFLLSSCCVYEDMYTSSCKPVVYSTYPQVVYAQPQVVDYYYQYNSRGNLIPTPSTRYVETKYVEKEVIKYKNVNRDLIDITISFDLNSSFINQKQMANIYNVAKYMKEHSDIKMKLIGFADANTGSSEYNYTLSIKRAKSVLDVLVNEYNINVNRLEIIGNGSNYQEYQSNNWNRCVIFRELK